MDTSLAESGMRYVLDCLNNYLGDNVYFLLFILSLLYLLINRNKKMKWVIIPYLCILLVTVFNIYIIYPFIEKLSFESEFYRFFWAVPIVFLIAYTGADLIVKPKKRIFQFILFVGVVALLFWQGAGSFYKEYHVAENIHKIPNTLIELCAIIHEDSEKENPKVAFDSEHNFTARQYDASILLTIRRDVAIKIYQMEEPNEKYQNQTIIAKTLFRNEMVDPEIFVKALEETQTDYLVCKRDLTNNEYPLHEYFLSIGCELVGEIENFRVYATN